MEVRISAKPSFNIADDDDYRQHVCKTLTDADYSISFATIPSRCHPAVRARLWSVQYVGRDPTENISQPVSHECMLARCLSIARTADVQRSSWTNSAPWSMRTTSNSFRSNLDGHDFFFDPPSLFGGDRAWKTAEKKLVQYAAVCTYGLPNVEYRFAFGVYETNDLVFTVLDRDVPILNAACRRACAAILKIKARGMSRDVRMLIAQAVWATRRNEAWDIDGVIGTDDPTTNPKRARVGDAE